MKILICDPLNSKVLEELQSLGECIDISSSESKDQDLVSETEWFDDEIDSIGGEGSSETLGLSLDTINEALTCVCNMDLSEGTAAGDALRTAADKFGVLLEDIEEGANGQTNEQIYDAVCKPHAATLFSPLELAGASSVSCRPLAHVVTRLETLALRAGRGRHRCLLQ